MSNLKYAFTVVTKTSLGKEQYLHSYFSEYALGMDGFIERSMKSAERFQRRLDDCKRFVNNNGHMYYEKCPGCLGCEYKFDRVEVMKPKAKKEKLSILKRLKNLVTFKKSSNGQYNA